MDRDSISFAAQIARQYDEGLGPVIFADMAVVMADRVAAAKPARVLETAAGTGIVSRQLRDRLTAAPRLTVTDLSPGMLEIARPKFGPGESIAVQQADALALPFPDASFDTVVCQFGVMFYPDKDKGYGEVRRVLESGGRYFFSVWDAHKHNPFGRIMDESMQALFPKDMPQFQRVPFGYGFDPIKDSLTAAGFVDIRADVVRMTVAIPDNSKFVGGMTYGNPLLEQMAARGTVSVDDVAADMLRRLDRECGNPGRMTIQAIFFEARKP
jgi:ubiquinone/menaquinone biosynthesis C-methylase UbiE